MLCGETMLNYITITLQFTSPKLVLSIYFYVFDKDVCRTQVCTCLYSLRQLRDRWGSGAWWDVIKGRGVAVYQQQLIDGCQPAMREPGPCGIFCTVSRVKSTPMLRFLFSFCLPPSPNMTHFPIAKCRQCLKRGGGGGGGGCSSSTSKD